MHKVSKKDGTFLGAVGLLMASTFLFKLCRIVEPSSFNYKGQHSIVLMATADYNYCFTYSDVGCNGIVSDGGVFQYCSLYPALESGLLPERYCLVDDDAFPLKTYLIKPHNSVPLTKEERIFNYHLSRARRIVENKFGILVSTFCIFEKKAACKLSTV